MTFRAVQEAGNALRSLTQQHPSFLDVQAAPHEARRRVQATMVNLLTSEQVTTLLNDSTRRVVRTAGQLADVIIETLEQIEADLPTHPNLLWTANAKTVPKAPHRERPDRSSGGPSLKEQ